MISHIYGRMAFTNGSRGSADGWGIRIIPFLDVFILASGSESGTTSSSL